MAVIGDKPSGVYVEIRDRGDGKSRGHLTLLGLTVPEALNSIERLFAKRCRSRKRKRRKGRAA